MEMNETERTVKDRARPHGKDPVGRVRILEAAGKLFVEQGYAATTTRQISTLVGIKQPSLYYHFPNKAAILLELLLATAQPSLTQAHELLADQTLKPLDKLLQLIKFDVLLLTESPSNIGALYLLPEVSGEAFASFRQQRVELFQAYQQLVSETVSAGQAQVHSVERTAALLFALVEGVILQRADAHAGAPKDTADDIEEATIRILCAAVG